MKYIKYLFAISLFASFVSCGDILDIYPDSAVSQSDVSEEDVELLYVGLYNFSQYKPTFNGYLFNDVMGGDLTTGSGTTYDTPATMIKAYMLETGGLVTGPWDGYYTCLYQVNTFISIVEKLEDTAEYREMLGGARFFRSLIYYYLVTHWRNVPLISVATTDPVASSPEADVWAFIENDLEYAIENLPGFTDKYFVSSPAAVGLMARVKLAQDKMDEAAKYAEELITGTYFDLCSYNDLFRAATNNEEIFSFYNGIDENEIGFASYFYYQFVPTTTIQNLFTSSDNRSSTCIGNYDGTIVMSKYGDYEDSIYPKNIVRLGEMYLISAEAQGYPAGLIRLNELRAFRGLGSVAVTGEDDFLNAVLEERRLELYCDGFRWYDLVRTGKLTSTLNLDEKYTVCPIPNDELLLNPLLEQHELWK
ncbi:MAG: RagB/SusD family nutrient uptake outer membrane protein [Rikenellaceae bacterium]